MAVFDCQDDSARLRTHVLRHRLPPTSSGLLARLVNADEGQAPDPQSEEESALLATHARGSTTNPFCLEAALQQVPNGDESRKRRRIALERAQRLPHSQSECFRAPPKRPS